MTERHRHHPQNFGVGHAFFILFHPRNSKLKKIEQLHGPANSSIELLSLTSTYQQSETNWMNVCPILASATDFLKNRTPPKNISYSTKTPNSKKKKFGVNIISNIIKPRIKSSVNGFRQISYEQEKRFLMSPLNSNKLKKFHFTTSQNNVTITVQKCCFLFFFFSIYVVMYCLFY